MISGNNDEWEIHDQDLRMFKVLLTDSRLASEFVNSQRSDLFLGGAEDIGKIIFNYIKTYKTSPTHRVLINEHSNNDLLREKINAIFESLPDIECNSSEYQYEVENLKKRFVDIKLADLKDSFRQSKDENDCPSVVDMERIIKDIKQVKNNSQQAYIQKPIKDYLHEFKTEYIAKLKNSDLHKGILTGYSYLDYVTNGILEGELVIVAAETGGGKSLLLNNIAIQMWMQKNTITTDPNSFTKGHNVLYFSLEMPYDACFQRTMARLADVPIYGLRDSSLMKSETDSVSLASRFISKYPYVFEIVDIPRGVTVETIEDRFLEAKSRYNPEIVVVDYLGLLEDNSGGDDWLKLGHIAGKLHEFGRANKVRVLTAAQLNRLSSSKKAPEQHEIVNLARMGRSSLVAHHANICIQIESRPDEHLRADFPYHITKNRRGEKGQAIIQKKFANAAILDVPFVAPGRDEFGSFISGFENENQDDISKEIISILGK